MTAISYFWTGAAGLVLAAGAAAPAAAQYYGGGYQGSSNVVGQVINQVLGGGRYGAYGQGNDRLAVDRCARAAEAEVNRTGYAYNRNRGLDYGGNPYRSYNGYNGARTARVVGITGVERRSNGGLKVFGLLDSGMLYNRSAYDDFDNRRYGYNQAADLRFDCRVDYRGYVTKVDIDRANSRAYRGY